MGAEEKKWVRSELVGEACSWHEGSPCCMYPQSVLGPLPTFCPNQPKGVRGTGREEGSPSWPPRRPQMPGSPQAPGEMASGRCQAWASRKVGPLFLTGPPSRKGALILVPTLGNTVPTSKRGLSGDGLGSGPCQPGLCSGQELGIKIDRGGRSWGGREPNRAENPH